MVTIIRIGDRMVTRHCDKRNYNLLRCFILSLVYFVAPYATGLTEQRI